MSKVIIFGGSGWLGHKIALDLAAHNYDVTVSFRGQKTIFLDKIKHLPAIIGNKREEAFIRSIFEKQSYDYVIDTAPHVESIECISKYAKNLKHYIHCSSTGGYAPLPFIPCDETAQYGGFEENSGWAGKAVVDNMVMKLFKENKFPATVMRPCYINGEDGLVPLDNLGGRRTDFIADILAEKTLDLPDNGLALLQPIHIDDLAVSFRLALEHPVSIGEIYNITLDHAVTLTRYIELNAEALGKKAHINYVPLEEMCKKYAGEINDTWLRFFATHMCFTNAKAKRDLEFKPSHTPEESIIANARATAAQLSGE